MVKVVGARFKDGVSDMQILTLSQVRSVKNAWYDKMYMSVSCM